MFREPMALNSKLNEMVPVNNAASSNPDVFGVEIELEGRKIITEDPNVTFFWEPHKDDSLRKLQPDSECIEYVFQRPMDLDATDTAIKVMFNYLNSPGVEVFPSYRTSIHVHMNYGIEPARVVYNAITLSIIFDELLTSQNGPHRIGNNFCLRTRDAEGQIADIVKSITNGGNLYNINHLYRYSSINYASLLKFGTIEYRSLECTTDYSRVRHWLDTILRIKIAARDYVNPAAIIETFNSLSPEQFCRLILKDQAEKYIAVEGYEKMLHRGMRLAQDLAYCSEWNELKPGEKPKPRVRRRSGSLKPAAFSTDSYAQYAGMSAAQIYQSLAAQNNAGANWHSPPPQAAPAPQPVVSAVEEVDLDDIFNLHNDEDDDEDFS